MKTFNLLEENCELLTCQAKSLTIVRQFNELEAEVTLGTMQFLVEIVQGPCKANQEYVAFSRKPVDVCKNILSSNFNRLKQNGMMLIWELWDSALQLISCLLESRGGDREIHDLLAEQIPARMLCETAMKVNERAAMLRSNTNPNGGCESEEDVEKLEAFLEDMSRCVFTIANELKEYSTEENDFASILVESKTDDDFFDYHG